MKTTTSASLLLTALLCASASTLHAQSFTNGSFENGITSHVNYNPEGGLAHDAVPDDWSLFSNNGAYASIGTSPDWLSNLGSSPDAGMIDFLISDGHAALGLDSYNAVPAFGLEYYEGGISQVVTGFQMGTEYQVTFDAASLSYLYDGVPLEYGASGFLDIYLNGTLYTSLAIANKVEIEFYQSLAVTGSMQEYAFGFIPGSSDVEIGFRSRIDSDATIESSGVAWRATAIVDNFNIAQIPEPAGALLLGATGMLALLRRRRAA